MFVAIVMLFLGLNLTELFPRFSRIPFSLPKSIGNAILGNNSTTGNNLKSRAFLLGAATFFLPCGFTFAMQISAMQSGSIMGGAILLALFALGTTPGLLGVGGVTSLFRGKAGAMFFRFVGTFLLLVSFWNFHNGLTLASSIFADQNPAVKTVQNAVQPEVIRLTYTSAGLSQKEIRVKR